MTPIGGNTWHYSMEQATVGQGGGRQLDAPCEAVRGQLGLMKLWRISRRRRRPVADTTGEAAQILGLDHIQVVAPRSEEAHAKAFYGGVLGLAEIPKPAALVERGGAWYRCGNLQLHLGLEDEFTPQRKGHPAFLVRDLAAMRARLMAAGTPIAEGVQIPGYQRFEARDPSGNRLEFLQRVASSEQISDEGKAIKDRVREVFGRSAEAYVASPTHATGSDLARLLELAAPAATDIALDVSTGGGHTALALAPHVARVVASDLTPRMLAAAHRFLTAHGATNADYVVGDAERLPFLDERFSLVTVRIAPHHYADVRAAVREMARVLAPAGRLIVIDNIAPESPALDGYVNEWDKRRDPSHVREYTVSEWREFLAAANLHVTDLEIVRKPIDFVSWVERTQMPAAERASLEADILAAPPTARAYFEVTERNGRLVSWSVECLIARAVK